MIIMIPPLNKDQQALLFVLFLVQLHLYGITVYVPSFVNVAMSGFTTGLWVTAITFFVHYI